jgi:signal transduction histidine kinase
MDKRAVLYIEDNRDNQRLVQRVLEAHGFAVQLAEDGPSGVALAREGNPALILVDLSIPGLDGYEVTTRLRNVPHLRDTPIVALTADSRPGTRDRSLVAGCDGYITKPIDPRRLPEQIQEFIAGRREVAPHGEAETSILREHNQKLVERLERQVRELSAANAELQELDRMKSQFLATLSHELRTPLTSILGYLELFERRTLGPLNDVQTQAIGVISRNSRTLTRILNNLLYLQEVRTNPLRPVPLALDDLARTIVGEYQLAAREAGIVLHATLQPEVVYQGDQTGITQSFRALIDNAVKFTPRGGRVDVNLAGEPTRVILRVTDTGIGIPAENLEKIFLPFYQVDDSLARPYPGAGLGLAIARHVAEAHSGQVSVRSQPGQGSTFTLVLPRYS